jgi:Ser/Thr protein kinase RdoA (MazF antagonist)
VRRFLREQFAGNSESGPPQRLSTEEIGRKLAEVYTTDERTAPPPAQRPGDPEPLGEPRMIELFAGEETVQSGDGLYRVDSTTQRRFSQEFKPFTVGREGIGTPEARAATHRAAQILAEAMHRRELDAIDRWLTTSPDASDVAAVRAELVRFPNTASAIMLRDGTIHAFTSVRDHKVPGDSVVLGRGGDPRSLLSHRPVEPLNHQAVIDVYASNVADRAGHEGVCAEPGAVSDIARTTESQLAREYQQRGDVPSRDPARFQAELDQRLHDELRGANIASHRVGGPDQGQEQFPCASDDVLVHHFDMRSDYVSRFADLAEVQPESGIVSLVPTDDPLRTHAAAIPSVDARTLVLVVHGEHTGDGFALSVGGERLSHVEIRRIVDELVRRYPQLINRDRIVLVSCESGRDFSERGATQNFAQRLAIRSGRGVEAPTGVAWISNRGDVAVEPRSADAEDGAPRPAWVEYDSHGQRADQAHIPFAGDRAPGGEGTSWLKADEQTVRAATDAAIAARSAHVVVTDAAIEHFVQSVDHIDATGPMGSTGALHELAKRAMDDPAAQLKGLGGGAGKGQSGAPVYFVKDENGATVAIAKIFPKIEEMVRELSAVERLRSTDFQAFTVPEPIDVAVADLPGGGRAGLYIMSVAKGHSIFEMLEALPAPGREREAALAEAAQAMRDAGTAFAELHTRPAGSGGPVSREFLEYHYGIARTELAEIANRANSRVLDRLGLDAASTVRRATELIDKALAADGGAALLHGDAHPGNLFWDEESGVTFIDFPAGHFAIAGDGHPVGAPERDMANMMERTALFGRQQGLTEPEIAQLQHAFRDAYQDYRDAVPDRVRELSAAQERGFTARYAIRDMLDSLRDLAAPGREVDPELIHRLTIQIELVKVAMGEAPHFEPGLDFKVTGYPDPLAMPPDPNRVFQETHAEAVAAMDRLNDRAEELLASGDGVGWFAKVYHYVTKFELEMIDGGHYTYPIMKLQEVVAFYDTYRVNLERWSDPARHAQLEPNWRAAFEAARSAGERWHAFPSLEVMGELLPSIESHIRFDLPRAIAAVFEAHYASSGLELRAFKADFDRMQIVFDRASEAVQKDIARITGERTPVRSRLDPGRSELLQKVGFPFVFNTPTERQYAWERAEDLVALHAQGLHDQPEMQRELESGHATRHPFALRDSFAVARRHIDSYDWNGQPEPGRPITAAHVPDSQFHGYGRETPDPVAVERAGRAALDQLIDRLPAESTARGLHLELSAVPAHDLPDRAVARSVRLADGGYRIELSDRTSDINIERAVAHELAEISAIEERTDLNLPDINALRPGDFLPGSRLSPHDLGRLAELDVLGRMLADPRYSEHARVEIEALREHLGLRPGEPGAAQRRALAEAHLSPEAHAALDSGGPPHGTAAMGVHLGPTGVRQAMALAVDARTPEGNVDAAAVERLVDALPVIDITSGLEPGLRHFVAGALGREVTLQDVRAAADGQGAKGLSGAVVRVVRDESGKPAGVAKTFPNREEFVRELSSLERLHHPPGFSKIKAPDVEAIGVLHEPGEPPEPVLVSSFAHGAAIDDLMKAVGRAPRGSTERATALERLTHGLEATAEAAAELHTRPEGSGGAVAPRFLERHTRAIAEILGKMDRDPEVFVDMGGVALDELRQRVEAVVGSVRPDALSSAIVHGDFHPGNVYWEPETGVTYIDTPTLHFSIDPDGRPIGTPERDMANFLERFSHYGRRLGMEAGEIADLRDTIISTYSRARGAPLDPATMTMFRVRAVLGKMYNIREELRDEMAMATPGSTRLTDLLADLRAEIGLLRDALGWRP